MLFKDKVIHSFIFVLFSWQQTKLQQSYKWICCSCSTKHATMTDGLSLATAAPSLLRIWTDFPQKGWRCFTAERKQCYIILSIKLEQQLQAANNAQTILCFISVNMLIFPVRAPLPSNTLFQIRNYCFVLLFWGGVFILSNWTYLFLMFCLTSASNCQI